MTMPLHHNLTSLYGGTGTLAMSGDGTRRTNTVVSIESVRTSETIAMLREAIEYLGGGSYTRTDDDGLTLRLVQQQRDQATARAERAERDAEVNQVSMVGWAKTSGSWQETAEGWESRALKAEKERDEADTANAGLQAEVDRWKARAENPRPLTADDITNDQRDRARAELRQFIAEGGQVEASEGARVRAVDIVLAAALTKPARPEGAEELARLIATADVGEWDCGDLADALLATGRVRVVTEEQP